LAEVVNLHRHFIEALDTVKEFRNASNNDYDAAVNLISVKGVPDSAAASKNSKYNTAAAEMKTNKILSFG